MIFTKMQLLLFTLVMVCLTAFSIPTQVQVSQLFLGSYQYDDAFSRLNQTPLEKETSVKALKGVKRYYGFKGNLYQAIEAQKRIVELKPKNREHLKELEKLYAWTQQPYQSLKVRERIARLDPSATNYRVELGDIADGYRWIRKFSDADRLYKELLPEATPEELRNIVQFYLASKRLDDALLSLNKLLEIKNSEADRKLLAETYVLIDQKDLALKQYLYILKGDRKEIPWEKLKKRSRSKEFRGLTQVEHYLSRISNLLKEKEDLFRYEDFMQQVTKHYNKNEDFLMEFAEYLFTRNRQQESSVYYRQVENLPDPFYTNLEIIASRYTEMKKYALAENLYKRLLQRDPTNIDQLEALAYLQELQNKVSAALKTYRKILKLQETKLNDQPRQGLIQRNQNRLPASESFTRESIKKEINTTQLRMLYLLEKTKDRKGIIEILKQIDINKVERKENLLTLAYLYRRYGFRGKALTILTRLKRRPPISNEVYGLSAEVTFAGKNYKRTLHNLDRWVPQKPSENIREKELREESLFQYDKQAHREFCRQVEKDYEGLDKAPGFLLNCYYRYGKTEKVRRVLAARVEANPKDSKSRTALIYTLLELNEYDEAERNLETLKDQGLFTKENKEQEKTVILGTHTKETRVILEDLLKEDPEQPKVRTSLIYTLTELGKYEEAAEQLDILTLQRSFTPENQQQKDYLEGLKFFESWFVDTWYRFFDRDGAEFAKLEADIFKRNNDWGVGVKIDKFIGFDSLIDPLAITPYAKIFRDSWTAELGWIFLSGRESFGDSFWAKGEYTQGDYYGSLTYDGEKLPIDFGDFFRTTLVSARSIVNYNEFKINEENTIIFSPYFEFGDYLQSSYSRSSFYFELQHHLLQVPGLSLLGVSERTRYSLTGTQVSFIPEELWSYFIGAEYKKRWNYTSEEHYLESVSRALVGGDIDRELGFGKIWFLRQSLDWRKEEGKGAGAYVQFANEVNALNTFSSFELGINLKYWF